MSQAEEKKSLDVTKERDQEIIIRDYLQATGYGDAEEIAEEIEGADEETAEPEVISKGKADEEQAEE